MRADETAGTVAAVGAPDHEALKVHRLVVLSDPGCSMCVTFAAWLAAQPQLVPVEIIDAGSAQAREHFPGLDHEQTLREITVIADSGAFWQGGAAWVMCLWALADHRALALRLTNPAGFAAARAVAYTMAGIHARTSSTLRPAAGPVQPPHNYVECRDGSCS